MVIKLSILLPAQAAGLIKFRYVKFSRRIDRKLLRSYNNIRLFFQPYNYMHDAGYYAMGAQNRRSKRLPF